MSTESQAQETEVRTVLPEGKETVLLVEDEPTVHSLCLLIKKL